MDVRRMLKILQDDGWILVRTKGSHRQFGHPHKPGLVTLAGHPKDELHPKTESSIKKQAGLK